MLPDAIVAKPRKRVLLLRAGTMVDAGCMEQLSSEESDSTCERKK